eukprot:gene7675-5380_t
MKEKETIQFYSMARKKTGGRKKKNKNKKQKQKQKTPNKQTEKERHTVLGIYIKVCVEFFFAFLELGDKYGGSSFHFWCLIIIIVYYYSNTYISRHTDNDHNPLLRLLPVATPILSIAFFKKLFVTLMNISMISSPPSVSIQLFDCHRILPLLLYGNMAPLSFLQKKDLWLRQARKLRRRWLPRFLTSAYLQHNSPPPCDCTDFVMAYPQPPSGEHLAALLRHIAFTRSPQGDDSGEVFSKSTHPTNRPESSSTSTAGGVKGKRKVFPTPLGEGTSKEFIESTFFDLTYRCGAGGRCAACGFHGDIAQKEKEEGPSAATGPPPCRFPSCFVMRPLTKGAEVWVARRQFETVVLTAPPHPQDNAEATKQDGTIANDLSTVFSIFPFRDVHELVLDVQEKTDQISRMHHAIQAIQTMVDTKWKAFCANSQLILSHADSKSNDFTFSTHSAPTALWQEEKAHVHDAVEGIAPATTIRSQQAFHIPRVYDEAQILEETKLNYSRSSSSKNTPNANDALLHSSSSKELLFGTSPSGSQSFLVQLQHEMKLLYLWRAALLVNCREDEKAVNSLLSLATALHPSSAHMATKSTIRHPNSQKFDSSSGNGEEKMFQIYLTIRNLYETATQWAVLNDMEIIVYRSMTKQYPSFSLAEKFAHDRPLLLPRVMEQVAQVSSRHTNAHHSPETSPLHHLLQRCAEIVLQKETTVMLSRLQSSQKGDGGGAGDSTEDPLTSLCVPLTLAYYRFRVHPEFWKHFFTLLCLPPLPPPPSDTEMKSESKRTAADHSTSTKGSEAKKDKETKTEQDSAGGCDDAASVPPLVPTHVLDAVGRSILLHHLVVFAETRLSEIMDGAVADRVQRILRKGDDSQPQPCDYDMVLDNKDIGIAKARLNELIQTIHTHDEEMAQITNETLKHIDEDAESGKENLHYKAEKQFEKRERRTKNVLTELIINKNKRPPQFPNQAEQLMHFVSLVVTFFSTHYPVSRGKRVPQNSEYQEGTVNLWYTTDD